MPSDSPGFILNGSMFNLKGSDYISEFKCPDKTEVQIIQIISDGIYMYIRFYQISRFIKQRFNIKGSYFISSISKVQIANSDSKWFR